jgi:antitoxin component HigA of HigAB toxin-antitoxin module
MPAITRSTVTDSYLQLIHEFPLRRIKTVSEHSRAVKLVVRLSKAKPDRGAEEYFDVLVDLLADYEKREGLTVDSSNLSAADIVRHRINQRGLSISALAKLIGMQQSNLSEMLSGKRGWSKTAIRGLCAHLNIRADRFLA